MYVSSTVHLCLTRKHAVHINILSYDLSLLLVKQKKSLSGRKFVKVTRYAECVVALNRRTTHSGGEEIMYPLAALNTSLYIRTHAHTYMQIHTYIHT
jgi:hypothetical protein